MFFKIKSAATEKCLDVPGGDQGNIGNGVPIQQWEYWGGIQQQWKIILVRYNVLELLRIRKRSGIVSLISESHASSLGRMLQSIGPTDAQKAAAQYEREQQMANGQVSMPPDWHPPTSRDTGIPLNHIMTYGGNHFQPGHPPILGQGGKPLQPPLLGPGKYKG